MIQQRTSWSMMSSARLGREIAHVHAAAKHAEHVKHADIGRFHPCDSKTPVEPSSAGESARGAR